MKKSYFGPVTTHGIKVCVGVAAYANRPPTYFGDPTHFWWRPCFCILKIHESSHGDLIWG